MELIFNEIIKELTKTEQSVVKKDNINDNEGLIPILLKRVPNDNLDDLIEILKQSVLPSVYSETNDEEINNLFDKIEKNKKLLFEKEIQEKIEKLIEKRTEKDKQVIIKKTSDISKFILVMEKFLNEAISSSDNGSQKVLSIKEKIQNINLADGGLEQLTSIQNELVNAASSIEEEMNTVNKKLITGKNTVQELEEKVKILEKELKKTKSESMKDHLTGLLTRRAYDSEIKRIESFYQRNDTLYAVVFFDLDHFKDINDTYGHEGGDVILSTFAKVLDKNTRDHDIVGRYGGEEFVSIVHFKLQRELLAYLKRIKTIVTQNSFVYNNQKIKVTFSAGVAIRDNYDSYQNAIQKADMLLYEAKENGRNQIKLDNGTVI